MVDIRKQIEYWRNGAIEDWQMGYRLVDDGHIRHGLFLVHLAMEKIVKAHVCKCTNDLAPRTHNLLRLLDKSALSVSEEQAAFLADLNQYNIEGRYPELYGTLPTRKEACIVTEKAGKIFSWLRDQL